MQERKGKLLRVYAGENDRYGDLPLYEWVVRQAHQRGIAGATVIHGSEGFGATHRIHTTRVLRLSTDLPIVVELIDTTEKIDDFLPVLDGVLVGGLVVVQDVQLRSYGQTDQKT